MVDTFHIFEPYANHWFPKPTEVEIAESMKRPSVSPQSDASSKKARTADPAQAIDTLMGPCVGA